MEILIITGMSGAGKTSAVNIAQDYNYTSIDNLPPKLIISYLDLIQKEQPELEKVAFVIDIRAGDFLVDLEDEINKVKEQGHTVKIIFVDASNDELIKRFQEKRRPHPYNDISLEDAIKKERKNLLNVREIADYYINTTDNNLNQLKNRFLEILDIINEPNIKIVSFGFKYGILREADFIFDTRFIENPYYIPELRAKSGLTKEIQDYVMGHEDALEFVNKIADLIEFIAPSFTKQGKNNILIGIGCTGGMHRSVTIAEKINNRLSKKFKSSVFHREEKKW